MHKRICDHCGIEFETRNKKKRFCSRLCSNKHMWENKEYRKKMSDMKKKQWEDEEWRKNTSIKMSESADASWTTERRKERSNISKEYRSRPDVKKMFSNIMKEKWEDDDFKNNHSKKMKEKWEESEFIIKMKNIHSNRLYKLNKSQKAKLQWEDEEYRKKMSIIFAKYWDNADNRKYRSDLMKALWEDVDYRNKMIEIMSSNEYKNSMAVSLSKLWEDETYALRHFKKCFKYKDYEMPSGRIVKIQGYEPQVLDMLLLEHDEDDIVIGVKEMNKKIGKIMYTEDGVEHRYYPDFYIKSTNTIIEVKSQWTYDKWKKKNELKKEACLSLGFNFKFIIC